MTFSFSSPQTIHFGRGQSQQAAAIAAGYGKTALLVHGANADRVQWLMKSCADAGLMTKTISCKSEPSLQAIEQALVQLGGFHPSVVVAVGGGSVMDFAKTLAALIPCDGSPIEYLEIVGTGRLLEHEPIPMIALPTTAGTGAEVTKNAVISVPERGLKVSLRDPRMIPQVAIVDPDLMQGAPKHVALCAGLDAITQVIEPYLSVKANPMTDALCLAAIPVGVRALRDVVEQDCPEGWDALAWVSTCGGLTLANAGLGAVHGFAGVIGGKTNAPHGEVCGALLPPVLESHLRHAEKGTDIHARLTWVMGHFDVYFGQAQKNAGLAGLRQWSIEMGLRGLNEIGLLTENHSEVAAAAATASSMKGNPFPLSENELMQILQAAK
ncbi:iron-containing alcohol dehydrogenase [Sulfitobacter sp.]|uniref:iron-containing alcohol dehydrogenase n=1 Tax=Sulfitobacter sp. TaxID=1903071 RepID=UPI00300227BF